MTDITWNGPAALRPYVVPIDTLHEDPDNARMHDDKNLRVIEASLRGHGQTQLLVLYAGKVLVGNGRLSVMRRMGWTGAAVMDVTKYFATAEQATAFAIGDNRANELGTWDFKGLSKQLAALPKESLPWTGYEGFEWQVLIESAEVWKNATQPSPKNPDKEQGPHERILMKPLKVTSGEAVVILEAIARMKGLLGDGHMKDGRAIELICGDYLS